MSKPVEECTIQELLARQEKYDRYIAEEYGRDCGNLSYADRTSDSLMAAHKRAVARIYAEEACQST